MTTFTYAYQCGLDSTDQIGLNTFGKTKACIKSLAKAPTTPEFSSLYFQKVSGKENFAFWCHTDDKSKMRLMFLGDDGLQTLTLPIYYYMSGIDHTDLPRNILHFKNQGEDLYIQFEYSDVINVFTPDKLPSVAKDMMYSMNRVQTEYIKKYETWLKTEGKSDAIKLGAPSEDDLPILLNCLEDKQQTVVSSYLQSKFSPQIPPYGTLVREINGFRNLTPEQKAKYQKPWNEIEKEFLNDIRNSHPDCAGVVSESSSQKALETHFGKNKDLYNRMRSYLSLE